jgi:hypothetical protein
MNVKAPGSTGGIVSVGSGPPTPVATATPQEVKAELKRAYDTPDQQSLIDELTAMLDTQEQSDAALLQFQKKLAQLLTSEPADANRDAKHPDYAEGAVGKLRPDKWRGLLETLGDRAMTGAGGGAAKLGNPFNKLWAGAKDALRIGTYWQMKQRAGIIGKTGLCERVLTRLREKNMARYARAPDWSLIRSKARVVFALRSAGNAHRRSIARQITSSATGRVFPFRIRRSTSP